MPTLVDLVRSMDHQDVYLLLLQSILRSHQLIVLVEMGWILVFLKGSSPFSYLREMNLFSKPQFLTFFVLHRTCISMCTKWQLRKQQYIIYAANITIQTTSTIGYPMKVKSSIAFNTYKQCKWNSQLRLFMPKCLG